MVDLTMAPEALRQGQGLTHIASVEEKPPHTLDNVFIFLTLASKSFMCLISRTLFRIYFRYFMFSLSLPCHLPDEHRVSATKIPTFTPRVLQLASQPIYEE